MADVKKTDWNTQPLPDAHSVVRLDHAYSEAEMTVIRRGLRPRQMEDKWFIYWENDSLHLHRSWTGACIYVARFEPLETGGARMVEARINRDPEQYRETSDERDAETVALLVRTLLLRKPAARTGKTKLQKSGEDVLRLWSELGRASIGEHPPDPDATG